VRVRNGPATVTRSAGESGRLPRRSPNRIGRPIPILAAGVDTRRKGTSVEMTASAPGGTPPKTPRVIDARAFPFSAIVGSDDLALALILTTVSPEVGGVLVRGEKGTAKTTMVRALAHVLPALEVVEHCRFSCHPDHPDPQCPDGPHQSVTASTRPARLVELPVGASEDRVIGALNLQQALGSGQVRYQPGLLAAAHRGILYVDEVNLLHDHLVDLLLDAAATGRSTVEREGISVSHASRIVLIGTMNPEEGELRPQLLDRFGLTVEIAAPRDPELRAEVVRRRMSFDADPALFEQTYAAAEQALRRRIVTARELLPTVVLRDDQLITIASICAAFEVDGMRADLVTARAAVASAAWHGRSVVEIADIRAAARLALPHRRRRNPFDAPGLDEDLLDQLLAEHEPDPDPPSGPGSGPPADTNSHPPPDLSEQSLVPGGSGGVPPGIRTVPAGATYRTRLLTAPGTGMGEAGRRSRALTATGRTVGAVPPRGRSGPLHLPATIRVAAPRQYDRGRRSGPLRLAGDDLRLAVTEGRESNLVLLVVDASGSMAARRRMETVKAVALSLLLDAYQRRDKVGLITFRGTEASLALPPTSSIDVAVRRLRDLPSGGRTPLAEGLLCAAETLRLERIRDPRRRPLLILVTDGRATYGPDAVARSRSAAERLRQTGVASVVIDCEAGRFTLGLAAELSDHLGAQHVPVGEVAADSVLSAVRRHAPVRPRRAA
jgi:magnesium chelatase subunit D